MTLITEERRKSEKFTHSQVVSFFEEEAKDWDTPYRRGNVPLTLELLIPEKNKPVLISDEIVIHFCAVNHFIRSKGEHGKQLVQDLVDAGGTVDHFYLVDTLLSTYQEDSSIEVYNEMVAEVKSKGGEGLSYEIILRFVAEDFIEACLPEWKHMFARNRISLELS